MISNVRLTNRSIASLAIVGIFAFAAAVLVLDKAKKAIDEIDRLNEQILIREMD